MKDSRIFRVTRTNGRVQYVNYRSVAGMFGTGLYGAGGHTVFRVEATNAEATEGWADVTAEFRNPNLPDPARCTRHKGYTGTRKPSYRWYADKLCTCWSLYGLLHPEYPKHSDYCDKAAIDPQHCECMMAAKLLG